MNEMTCEANGLTRRFQLTTIEQGSRLRMIVQRGAHDAQAVQFVVLLGWTEKDAPEPDDETGFALGAITGYSGAMRPMPADLGFHSPIPLYEGMTAMDECDLNADGAGCHYDGSTSGASKPWHILCTEGMDAAWAFLEAYWHETFDDVKRDDGE